MKILQGIKVFINIIPSSIAFFIDQVVISGRGFCVQGSGKMPIVRCDSKQ